MKILITGAFGFVGTNISYYLKKHSNHTLEALDLTPQKPSVYSAQYTWQDLDVIDWNQIDSIIHLAGKAHDTRNTTDPQSYFNINYGLTKLIFDRFLQSRTKTFIFFSSVKAAADTVQNKILLESHPANPKTPYGQSKHLAEEYILSEMAKITNFQGTGKRVYLLRPCMIHGPGNKGNLNLLFNIVRKGLPYPLGAFDNQRSFTSIDNLCFVLKQLINGKAESGIYQMSDDEPLSSNELITLISETLGHNKNIWHINPSFIYSLVRVCDLLHLPLNSERLKKLTENYVVSNAKLKQALGIVRMPVSAKDGLRKTIQAFDAKFL